MSSFLCIYFLISFIPVFYCTSFDECGISYKENSVHTLVRSPPGSWPWVVAIFANGRKICTGSIISRNYILTAAYCSSYMQQDAENKNEKVNFSIRAGSVFANSGGVVINVKSVTVYDEFYSTDFARNDIALFELEKPLTFNRNISKICLPKFYKEVAGKSAVLAGFGEFHWRPIHPNNIRQLQKSIPFQNFSHCQRFNQEWNYATQNYICSGALRGDGGGPLMVKEGTKDPRWFEVGVVVGSYSPEKSKKQQLSQMVSTRVSFYCDWIEENTNGDAKCVDIEQRSIHNSITCPAEDSSGPCIDGKCVPGFVCDSSMNKCCPSLGTSLEPCIGGACPKGAYCLISQNLCYNLIGASTTSNDPCVEAASGAVVGPPTNEGLCPGSAVAKDGNCMCP